MIPAGAYLNLKPTKKGRYIANKMVLGSLRSSLTTTCGSNCLQFRRLDPLIKRGKNH